MKKRQTVPLKAALSVLALGLGAIIVLHQPDQPAVAQPDEPSFGPPGPPPGGPPPGGPLPGGPLENALRRLNLTPQQQAQVQAILEEERARLHNRIRGVLTPQQRAQFEQMISRPGFGPGGQPGGFGADGGRAATTAAHRVEITVQGEFRYVRSNGIPNHMMGQFPNPGNPNAVEEQEYNFRIPLHPKAAQEKSPVRHDLFGVALSGVPFDPATGEFWNNDRRWNYDALSGKINLGMDSNHAHVQPGGVYHYHGLPEGLIDKLDKKNQMTMVGYAADGFPIYAEYGHAIANDPQSNLKKLRSSYRLKQGTRPSGQNGPGGTYDGTFTQDREYVAGSGDLDECNGRIGVTLEYPQGTYYYVLTDEFPFVPRYFRGTPDASFRKAPPGGSGPGGALGRPPMG